ncbi:MAG TPA: 5-oxoprolinase subunit PxpA [Synergistales bacterium]|nr:5-oxoprolinase subunit PxpA [Synergistales bacterium]HQO83597.1 5-oxoprolinase subunit PxpA [Synergistales bacterium]
MAVSVDLNSDLGEGFGPWKMGDDSGIMDHVTSINIACGFHAGDPGIMVKTAELALERGIAIGAHPGYPDLVGFGRREMGCSPEEIYSFCLYQVGALSAIVRSRGGRLQHVKAHGALYSRGAKDEAVARAISLAAGDLGGGLIVVGPPASCFEKVCQEAGILFAAEMFADRAYASDGSLVPRSQKGSVIEDPREAASRVVRMATTGEVPTIDGGNLKLRADTICLHGDTPGSTEMASVIRSSLEEAGVSVLPLGKLLWERL